MRGWIGFWLVGAASVGYAGDAADELKQIASVYQQQTLPLLTKHCLDCHSTAEHQGELDLERFRTIDDIRLDPSAWLKVSEMVENGEMPPKDADPLPAEKRKELLDWVHRYLDAEAKANAGDPGPVVLRRLNNAEYTYTVRDLIGVPAEPAKEFPADSAAGEGFTNTGNSLVMSPALLQKYLDAGKEIARHAVLLPTGIRFSPSTTRGDWNNEILARIRSLYERHSEVGGAVSVNLQGVIFNTNDGGRIPLGKYLGAAREAIQSPQASIESIATKHQANAKYLGILVDSLRHPVATPSLISDLHHRLQSDEPIPDIAEGIARWQRGLTRFQNVGHMRPWMVSVNPLTRRQEVRVPFPAELADRAKNPSGLVKLYLGVGDAGDGPDGDLLLWEYPRFTAPGRPDLVLRDVRSFVQRMKTERERLFASTKSVLGAAVEANGQSNVDRAALATKHGVDLTALEAWFDYLGIGVSATSKLDLFTQHVLNVGGYEAVSGWGLPELPSIVANASTSEYRIPGHAKGHGICVHPAPQSMVAVGWKSPISGDVRIQGKVTHVHPECGNGVTWTLDVRRSTTRRTLAEGIAHGPTPAGVGPVETLRVEAGDLVSLFVGPRNGDHSCDLTDVELTITEVTSTTSPKIWNLSNDVATNIRASNPHADSLGNAEVWHFYQQKVDDAASGAVIVSGSLLDRWQSASSFDEKRTLAGNLEQLLVHGPPPGASEDQPDVRLYRQLASLGGPLLLRARSSIPTRDARDDQANEFGLPSTAFGQRPDGKPTDPVYICVQAPSMIEITLPAELVAGGTFAASASVIPTTPSGGSVQLWAGTERTPDIDKLAAGQPVDQKFTQVAPDRPIIVAEESETQKRFEQSFEQFRQVLPAALCYHKIVPVDEVITLTLFHREDQNLSRLMLSDSDQKDLDELWTELHFVSQDKLTTVDAFLQLLEYASQDGRPSDYEPLRPTIMQAAEAFKKEAAAAEVAHVQSVIDLASRAFRRPLTQTEEKSLRDLYAKLRSQEIAHEDAINLVLARVFVSPAFLYRLEQAPAGRAAGAVSDYELASRLSYFLWSSLPDDQLRALAEQGRLHDDEVLRGQVKRMLADSKIRRLAQEFGCQWLQIYGFHTLDEKSERHFPEFVSLRADMEEEGVQFLTHAFQEDQSLLNLFDADHTYVNDRLASFYGLNGVEGSDWRRMEGVKRVGRGGVLGLAATMAKNSGASRTSPILRGTWISETILGEKLPKPPKDVPILPDEDSSTAELTVRQLVEKHSSDEKCAGCHRKIDPLGFALENYDAIGRFRTEDLSHHPIDASTTLPDGTAVNGASDLRAYLLGPKKNVVVRQFLRKLLGYSLGRSVQLSDLPLLEEMERKLASHDYRLSVAIESIVLSDPFRSIRGQEQDVSVRE